MPVGFEVSRELDVDYPGAVRKAQRQRLEDAMGRGWQTFMRAMPEDQGDLKSGAFEPEWEDGKIRYGVANKPHAKPMEFGTDPFHPPVKPLVEWAERVSGDPGLGYYVANVKIPEEGISAQPYARPSKQAVEHFLKQRSLGDYLEREL